MTEDEEDPQLEFKNSLGTNKINPNRVPKLKPGEMLAPSQPPAEDKK